MSEKQPNEKPRLRPFRRLGPFECYQNVMHTTGMYAGTMITGRYTIPQDILDSSLHSEVVRRLELAIARAVLEHPFMQVGLINADSKKPTWIHLDSVDLGNHVEWRSVADDEAYNTVFDDVVKRQVSTDFTNLETQPGWRAIILRQDGQRFVDVMFCWNHANFDGTGGKVFHQTLLRHLNTGGNTESGNSVLDKRVLKTTATARNLPPPIHVVGQFSTTPKFLANSLWTGLLKPPAMAKNNAYDATWAPVRIAPNRTQLKSLSIPSDALRNVLAACRKNMTTLSGLLSAVVLISLTQQLPEKKAPAMVADTAMSLRRHLPSRPAAYPWLEPEETMANYVTMMEHKFGKPLLSNIRDLSRGAADDAARMTALEGLMWSTAKTVRKEIEERIDLGLRNEIVGLMKLVPDWKAYVKDELKKPRGHSYTVTNLGVVDGAAASETTSGDGGGWSLQRATFALSRGVFGSVLAVSAISVKGGELSVSVTWGDNAVDASIPERLAVDIEEWLRYIGSGSV